MPYVGKDIPHDSAATARDRRVDLPRRHRPAGRQLHADLVPAARRTPAQTFEPRRRARAFPASPPCWTRRDIPGHNHFGPAVGG